MRRSLPALAVIITVLAAWEGAVRLLRVPEYLLPPPSAVLQRIVGMDSTILTHLWTTGLESVLGFGLAASVGFVLAVAFVHYRTLEFALYPYVIGLKTVPIVAIAPLLVVWFGNGLLPKVVVAALISFFPIVVNATRGLQSVDPEVFDVFDSLSATPSQVFFKLRVPASLPYLFASFKISSTLAVVGAIVGEFSGADRGLGFFIMISSYRLATVDVFVGILMASSLGLVFFYAIVFLERVTIPWGRGTVELT